MYEIQYQLVFFVYLKINKRRTLQWHKRGQRPNANMDICPKWVYFNCGMLKNIQCGKEPDICGTVALFSCHSGCNGGVLAHSQDDGPFRPGGGHLAPVSAYLVHVL